MLGTFPSNPMLDRADQIYRRIPTVRLEQHFFYPIQQPKTNGESRIIKSPRRLRSLCIRKLITNEKYLHCCLQQEHIRSSTPANIFYSIGQEAIFMNEHQIIEILIAYWPLVHLEIYRLLPLSSLLVYLNNQQQDDEMNSIAKFLERKLPDGSTLLDYIVMGLVNTQKDISRLKIVDFHRCTTSIQMTKELFRLPLLWTAPHRRSLLQKRTYIEKSILEKYIEGFNYVYQYYDKSITHETNFGRIYILL
ncbi:hypothetical protein I4U23_007370 [Adineta vaga]|nr:hypothetical protein I4U23_007370 [Adineta vaga]